jgi:hypothetical protein
MDKKVFTQQRTYTYSFLCVCSRMFVEYLFTLETHVVKYMDSILEGKEKEES